MNLPTLDKLNVKNKRVLLRLDLDVPLQQGRVVDDFRLKASLPTIKFLLEKGCLRITVIGHLGRPGGRKVRVLSLKPVATYLHTLLERELGKTVLEKREVFVMENVRFHPGEVEGGRQALEFARYLAQFGDVYINDAFAASHRESASIVLLPQLLPHAAGLRLSQEISVLGKVLENPKQPVVIIVGGGKIDKAILVAKLLDHGEVLAGGVLPKKIKSYCREDGRMCIAAAELIHEGKDISNSSAIGFVSVIETAGTIVWDGPMGDIDSGFWKGTKTVAEAVAKSNAYKVVGGGDTIGALRKLQLLDKMDYISTGGGAMLEFFAYGDLPGLRALRGK